jgi:hypothetical protein
MGVDGITSFSTKPIEIITLLSALSFFAVIAGAVGAVVYKVQAGSIPVWLSAWMSVWAVGAFQLAALRIVGEYVGKSFKEAKRRPRYAIAERLLSENNANAE